MGHNCGMCRLRDDIASILYYTWPAWPSNYVRLNTFATFW